MSFSPTDTFAKGNEHFLEAVTKARAKAGIKTRDERRRESLKKKIVVVGVADGSPGRFQFSSRSFALCLGEEANVDNLLVDGRVSEWL